MIEQAKARIHRVRKCTAASDAVDSTRTHGCRARCKRRAIAIAPAKTNEPENAERRGTAPSTPARSRRPVQSAAPV